MSKMIQIRNVPDDVHRTLKVRAAEAGMSLSDYLKRDLVRAAGQPTWQELEARLRAHGPSKVTRESILADLDEVRGR